jgi:diaminopimelate epimerase
LIALLAENNRNKSVVLQTLGGIVQGRVQDDGDVCVQMPPPAVKHLANDLFPDIPGDCDVYEVSLGNPHLVLLGYQPSLETIKMQGPALERHPLFPNRTNVSFVQKKGNALDLVVWERGAGLTQACGSGACAAAVAAFSAGIEASSIEVCQPGGVLIIQWDGVDLWMTGAAQIVYTGCFAQKI